MWLCLNIVSCNPAQLRTSVLTNGKLFNTLGVNNSVYIFYRRNTGLIMRDRESERRRKKRGRDRGMAGVHRLLTKVLDER